MMNQSHDDHYTAVPQEPDDTEESTRINRRWQPPRFFSSRLASVVSIFFIGLVGGFPGGLLLGQTAVTLLQSLELLTSNNFLMNQLGKLLTIGSHTEDQNKNTDYIYVSLLVEEFSSHSLVLSLAVGIFLGLSTYQLVIKTYGATAMGKALAHAGPVCLTGVSVTGALLGLALERSLLIISTVDSKVWFGISIALLFVVILYLSWCRIHFSRIDRKVVFLLILAKFPLIWIILNFGMGKVKIKMILLVSLIPLTIIGQLRNTRFILQSSLPLATTLYMIDAFDWLKLPIVTTQSDTMKDAVLEGLFVGALTVQILMIFIGIFLLETWQTGGAFKICGTSAALGGAAIAALRSQVLGPGPTIGALVGVSGAAGVSLGAAQALTDKFTQEAEGLLFGRLGLTIGAVIGTLVFSHSHNGLSTEFICSSIYAGLFSYGCCIPQISFYLIDHNIGRILWLCSCICFIVFVRCLYYISISLCVYYMALMIVVGICSFFTGLIRAQRSPTHLTSSLNNLQSWL
ncbi:putative LOC107391326-like protein [Nothobranchius furzeri]|uniref:LOC107391326-like protein n=1 Tax=Nothobranchius furzeri TaxID=105023 RepID=A0A9D2XXY4_NOTFU|nr:putative LOC107391326-like protein [Nothobranchius furzeri]